MDKTSNAFDWNQARAFLATAEQGSLSAAARALGLTQPTVGRQVAALEQALDVALFERVGRSLALTPSGLELLEHVRAMGDAAGRVSLAASGRSQSIEGQVCITASDVLAAYQLPPVLERLRERAPGIEIEVLASNDLQDLRRREADIAVRHVRPDQPDLITRLLRMATAHLYASRGFLERHGRPGRLQDLAGLPFVCFGNRERMVARLTALGLPIDAGNFRLVTNSGIAGWEMVRRGLGVSVMSTDVAALSGDVEPLLPGLFRVEFPLWLTTHRELHSSRRIRLVFDLLAETLAADTAAGP